MKFKFILLSILFIPYLGFAKAQQAISINQVTGAKTWETSVDGVHFSLTQILPDQLRAFYVNRGFTLKQIELYATSCVYMTILRNDNAPGTIHFISNSWTILVNRKTLKLKSVKYWVQYYKDSGVKKSALLAFRWAQFPPEQEYKPGGDWNQGMLSIGLPSKSIFDAIAQWDIKGTKFKAELAGVECAK